MGWTLLSKIVIARRKLISSTAWITSVLDVNMYANLLWSIKISTQKKRPMTVDCATETFVANFAALPLPAPSSFATLTLWNQRQKTFSTVLLCVILLRSFSTFGIFCRIFLRAWIDDSDTLKTICSCQILLLKYVR